MGYGSVLPYILMYVWMLAVVGIQVSERRYFRKIQGLSWKRRNVGQSEQEVEISIQREIQENGNTKGNFRNHVRPQQVNL